MVLDLDLPANVNVQLKTLRLFRTSIQGPYKSALIAAPRLLLRPGRRNRKIAFFSIAAIFLLRRSSIAAPAAVVVFIALITYEFGLAQ